jgi:hypothetical protein
MWSLLSGAALPWVAALVIQYKWAAEVKAALTLAACALVALGTTYFTVGITLDNWVGSVLLVAVTAYGLRKGLYQTALGLDKFEQATDLPTSG